MTDRIEMLSRLKMPDAINVEGHKKDSPTGFLALGQTESRMQMDRYKGEKNRIILNDTLSEKGIAEKVLELAADVVKQLEIIGRNRSKPANARINTLNGMMEVVDGDDPHPAFVTWTWERLQAMSKSERSQAVHKAFADDDKLTIFAVLNWPSINDDFDPKWIEALRREYGKARNPLASDEFATLTDNRDRLKVTIEQAILEISNDSGLGKNTLPDRMNAANDLIRESQINREESTDDHLSGKNARSVHSPNTPVTA